MEQKLKRGCLLSGWLWLQLIGSVLSIVITWTMSSAKLPGAPKTPLSQQIFGTIIGVIFIISIIGIFLWKKVFVYGYIGGTLLSFVSTSISTFTGQEFRISMLVGGLIGIALNLWAAYALLKLFKKLEEGNTEESEDIIGL